MCQPKGGKMTNKMHNRDNRHKGDLEKLLDVDMINALKIKE